MSNFLGQFASYSQLPAIDGISVYPSDSAYTLDDGGYWIAKQPSAPPGAQPQWLFIDVLRGNPGSQGPPGVALPGPQGQIGPQGRNGSTGPQGPPGRASFSFLSTVFRVPDANDTIPLLTSVSDSSWMSPGLLVYIPGAGTFTVIGSPPTPYTVNLVNSGDPTNAPTGTMIAAGTMISPANMRGPLGPQGQIGPSGPPGPQGVSGVSVYTTLRLDFSIPVTTGIAFVNDASPFSVGQIVYVEGGDYFSVQGTDDTANTLTLVNQNYPGGQPPGTDIPAGNTVSGTGPQGPPGPQGEQGLQGTQGLQGVALTGTMAMWPATVPPGGWLICNGQAVPRSQYPDLFAILSTTWGAGDGSSTFNLPDMRDAFPVGVSATKPVTSSGGEAAHALTIAELAVHAHILTDPGHVHPDPKHSHTGATAAHSHNDTGHVHPITGGTIGMSGTPQAVTPAAPHEGMTYYIPQNIGLGTGYAAIQAAAALAVQTNASFTGLQSTQTNITMASVGSGTAHNNMPPYKAVHFIIKAS